MTTDAQLDKNTPMKQYTRRGGLSSPKKDSVSKAIHISVGNGNKFKTPPKDPVNNQPQD